MLSDVFRGLASCVVDVSSTGAEIRRSADLQRSKLLYFIISELQKAKTIVRPRSQTEDFAEQLLGFKLIDDLSLEMSPSKRPDMALRQKLESYSVGEKF